MHTSSISLLKFASASLEARIIFMTAKLAKLPVGVAILSFMHALLKVIILPHETGSQGKPFGPEIKTFTGIMYSLKFQQRNHSTNVLQVF